MKEETVNTELFKGTAAQLFCGDCLAAKARAVRVNSSDLEAKLEKRNIFRGGWVDLTATKNFEKKEKV